jgi:hypothetical protein
VILSPGWPARHERGSNVIDEAGIQTRLERLERLSGGLAKEVVLIRAGNDPLLYLERKSYLNAIQDALAGVEAARVVLAKVCQRLAGGDREEGAA